MAFSQKGGWFGIHDGEIVSEDVLIPPVAWYVVLSAIHVHKAILCVFPYFIEDFGCKAV